MSNAGNNNTKASIAGRDKRFTAMTLTTHPHPPAIPRLPATGRLDQLPAQSTNQNGPLSPFSKMSRKALGRIENKSTTRPHGLFEKTRLSGLGPKIVPPTAANLNRNDRKVRRPGPVLIHVFPPRLHRLPVRPFLGID